MVLSRRSFLTVGGTVGAAGALGLTVPLSSLAHAESTLASRNRPVPYRAAFRRPPVLQPYWTGRDADGRPMQRYVVTQARGEASILPGLTTPVIAYNGMVPGPTIKVEQGTAVEVAMRNRIGGSAFYRGPVKTSTHLHGSASLPQYDGYADDLAAPGQVKRYEYPNWQRPRTIWYHDHAVHRSAENAYSGLYGMYQITGPAEREQLPQGEYDVPLQVTDATFARDGRLAFDDQGHDGVWGDIVLVNGVPWPEMAVKPRVYRFRILNASPARSYRLTTKPQLPTVVVGGDGGLFRSPQPVTSFRQSNGERVEVLVDFRGLAPGALVELRNLSNKNNDDFAGSAKVMRFRVVEDPDGPDRYEIPSRLDIGSHHDDHPAHRDLENVSAAEIDRLGITRRIVLDRGGGQWQINDHTWHDIQADGYRTLEANPKPYDLEVWEVSNTGGGWFHPFHLHLADALVVRRNTNGGKPFAWERGLKDTFYIGENEVVRLLVQFDTGPGNEGGKYMLHCHNLSHEDHDMMSQYAVGDPGVNDPVKTAPPVSDTASWPAPVYAPAP